MSFKRDLQQALAGRYAWLTRLILINVVVFLVVNILLNVFIMASPAQSDALLRMLAMPTDAGKLPSRIWTIFTSMFVHGDFMHLLMNMLWLYFGGRLMSEFMSGQRLLLTYLLGGFSAAALLIISTLLFPDYFSNGVAFGASGAVMAVVVGIAAYMPDYPVMLFGIIGTRLKYVALVSFLLVTIIDLSANTGGKIAHLGGAVWGFIYGTQVRRNPKFLSSFSALFTFPKKKPKMRVEHRRPMNDQDYNATKASIRKRIDEILDKISRSGYESLNKEEREFLHKNGGNI